MVYMIFFLSLSLSLVLTIHIIFIRKHFRRMFCTKGVKKNVFYSLIHTHKWKVKIIQMKDRKKQMSQNRKNRNKLNGKTIINAREKKEMRFSSFFYSFLHTTTATMKPLPSTLWTMNWIEVELSRELFFCFYSFSSQSQKIFSFSHTTMRKSKL